MTGVMLPLHPSGAPAVLLQCLWAGEEGNLKPLTFATVDLI